MLCGSGLITRKLLILHCANNAKNALIAGPCYVEVTWSWHNFAWSHASSNLRVFCKHYGQELRRPAKALLCDIVTPWNLAPLQRTMARNQ